MLEQVLLWSNVMVLLLLLLVCLSAQHISAAPNSPPPPFEGKTRIQLLVTNLFPRYILSDGISCTHLCDKCFWPQTNVKQHIQPACRINCDALCSRSISWLPCAGYCPANHVHSQYAEYAPPGMACQSAYSQCVGPYVWCQLTYTIYNMIGHAHDIDVVVAVQTTSTTSDQRSKNLQPLPVRQIAGWLMT